jgi:hypothetical protein
MTDLPTAVEPEVPKSSNQATTIASPLPDSKAEQQQDSSSSAKMKVSELLDAISKITVAGLLALYACGFVIISISNAEYGFTEVNPLRARILGAGALFAALTAAPLMIAHTFFPRREIADAEQRYARNIVAVTRYLLKCNSYVLPLMLIYAASVAPAQATKTFWKWSVFIFIMILLVSLSHFIEWGDKAYTKHPRKVMIVGSVLLLFFFVWLFVEKTDNRFFVELETWFFGVGLLIAIDRWTFWKGAGRRMSEWSAQNWSALLLLMFPMLFYFARVVYPMIQPSWGGGSPTRVIVYFSKDSRILPNQQFEGALIDESDSGMYVVKRGERQAIFIPRQAVSALYFADKPLAPEFLKDAPSNQLPTQAKAP